MLSSQLGTHRISVNILIHCVNKEWDVISDVLATGVDTSQASLRVYNTSSKVYNRVTDISLAGAQGFVKRTSYPCITMQTVNRLVCHNLCPTLSSWKENIFQELTATLLFATQYLWKILPVTMLLLKYVFKYTSSLRGIPFRDKYNW